MESKNETIVLGGGCFWCTQAVFEMLKGVTKTTAGYAGGEKEDPTYEDVAYKGNTGHAEVVKIEFDPKTISLETLLEVFLKMHNPTSRDFQGVADYGTMYRSTILCTTPGQQKTAERFIKKAQKDYNRPIVTEIRKLDRFYTAEEEHQKFYDKHPLNPYCIFVTRPEVAKIKKEFASLLK